MARQRKSKNELDAILEQLKRSYGSDSSDILEDDLLETPAREEDAELNEILGKIFSSEKDENEDSASYGADVEKSEVESSIIDLDLYHEIVNEADNVVKEEVSVEENVCIEDNISAVEEIAEETADVPVVAESAELDGVEESAISEQDESDEAYEGLLIEVSASDILEDGIEEPVELVEEAETEEISVADPSENERAVEDVLNIMFAGRKLEVVEAEEDSTKEIATDDTVDGGSFAFDFEETEEAEEIEETVIPDEDEDFDEDFEEESEDYVEYENIDYTDGDDDFGIENDEAFAVEDEEYDVSEAQDEEPIDESIVYEDADDFGFSHEYVEQSEDESELPIELDIEPEPVQVPKLVLLAEDYTDDPLQEILPIIGAMENKAPKNEKVQSADLPHPDQQEKKTEVFDKNDISMLLNFGYGNEIKNRVGEKKAKEILLEKDRKFNSDDYEKPFGFCGKELTDRSQLAGIKEKYRSNRKITIALLAVISVLTLAIIVVDLVFEFHPDRIANYPALLTIEFALVLLTSVIQYKKLISGILGIVKFEMKSSSIYSFVTLMYGGFSLASLIIYFFTYNQIDPDGLMLFGFCVSLYGVLSILSDLLTCIKEYNTFKIIESSDELYIAEKQTAFSPLGSKGRFKSKEDQVYKIRKTSLVSGYFGKTAKRDKSSLKPIYLIGVVPIISLVIGGICFFFGKSPIETVSVTMLTAMLCLPVGYICVPAFVEYFTSKWVSDKKIAFVGNGAAEEMSKAELIILKDTDTVEITSYTEIRPSNRTDINESLDIAYEIFRILGGPLSGIGNGAGSKSEKPHRDIVINQVTDHGIDVYFDSSTSILLGDRHYMRSHNIKVKTDGNLSTAVRGVDRSVLYMAFDGIPKLGFIVNSRIKAKFIRTANMLSEEGVRVFVETYEPQINALYYEQNKGDCSTTIGVIKPEVYEDNECTPMCDGCIISGSDALNLAQAICVSKEIRKQKSLSGIINLVMSLCGVAIACGLTALVITEGNEIAIFSFLSEHMTLLFGLIMTMGIVPGIIEIIRISKRKR